MADFCYDCSSSLFGEGERNDMRRPGAEAAGVDMFAALCEGCGVHIFRTDGRRLCDGEGVPEEMCEDCMSELEDE